MATVAVEAPWHIDAPGRLPSLATVGRTGEERVVVATINVVEHIPHGIDHAWVSWVRSDGGLVVEPVSVGLSVSQHRRTPMQTAVV